MSRQTTIALVCLTAVAVSLVVVYGWIESTGGDTSAYLAAVPNLVVALLALLRTNEIRGQVQSVQDTTAQVQRQTNGALSRQHEINARLVDLLEQHGISTTDATRTDR